MSTIVENYEETHLYAKLKTNYIDNNNNIFLDKAADYTKNENKINQLYFLFPSIHKNVS